MYMFIRSYSSILQNTRGAELAPLEAIWSGSPVIVTTEVEKSHRTQIAGIFVDFSDVESLAAQICYVIENPNESQQKADGGIEYIINILAGQQSL